MRAHPGPIRDCAAPFLLRLLKLLRQCSKAQRLGLEIDQMEVPGVTAI
jgi:hypothetical protein